MTEYEQIDYGAPVEPQVVVGGSLAARVMVPKLQRRIEELERENEALRARLNARDRKA